jgi:hypothetical protein
MPYMVKKGLKNSRDYIPPIHSDLHYRAAVSCFCQENRRGCKGCHPGPLRFLFSDLVSLAWLLIRFVLRYSNFGFSCLRFPNHLRLSGLRAVSLSFRLLSSVFRLRTSVFRLPSSVFPPPIKTHSKLSINEPI